MRERFPVTYILASAPYGTLYIGVTSNLEIRMGEHRRGLRAGFTKRYGIKRLVHFESFAEMTQAIAREKRWKRWHRDWKINLVNAANPDWRDLAEDLGFPPLMEE